MALIHVDFFSEVLGMSSQMEVILPQQTEGQIGIGHVEKQNKYPVLYLLHGMTDNQTIWTRNTSIERYAADHGIAVVMPNAHLGWYTDMQYGFDYFTFFSEELPTLCERFFPCISNDPKDRFVTGNSMGGYGAFKLGLTCPEKYAAIGGVAGSYHAEYRYQGKVNTVSTLCEALYGDPPAITPEVHDVFTLLKNRKEEGRDIPRLYTCCGTEDRRHQDSVDLKEFADQLGVPLLFEEGPGRHDDIFFDEYIQKILDWMNFAGKSVEE